MQSMAQVTPTQALDALALLADRRYAGQPVPELERAAGLVWYSLVHADPATAGAAVRARVAAVAS